MWMQRLREALADRYVVERTLGAGGMATVYLASDLRHDRRVAIKVLKPELAAVLGASRRGARARRTLARRGASGTSSVGVGATRGVATGAGSSLTSARAIVGAGAVTHVHRSQ